MSSRSASKKVVVAVARAPHSAPVDGNLPQHHPVVDQIKFIFKKLHIHTLRSILEPFTFALQAKKKQMVQVLHLFLACLLRPLQPLGCRRFGCHDWLARILLLSL